MTINDLSVLLAAVEIAVKRGAYSVLEVGAVGEMATKLGNFLQEAKAQAEAAQAEAGAQNVESTSEDTSAVESTAE